MKEDKYLYMTSKKPTIDDCPELKEKMPLNSGGVIFISTPFVNAMTDDVFKVFCSLDLDYQVSESTLKVIKERMKRQCIDYAVDSNNNSISTSNGKESN